MAYDYCPFLEDTHSVFGAAYRCKKTGRETWSSEKLFKEYCSAGERYYAQCPHFRVERDQNCFLTSACTEAMGLDDDCLELTTLRHFRDHWLANQPDGKDEIAEYYRIAPNIVKSIRALPNCQQIFQSIYDELLLPCIGFINAGKYAEAHELYRQKTKALEAEYLTL